jgi:hypothetical protein
LEWEGVALPESIRSPVGKLMRICLVTGLAASALALGGLAVTGTRLSWHLAIALSLAITGSLLLAGGLMGLLFASSRSGHDEEAGRQD